MDPDQKQNYRGAERRVFPRLNFNIEVDYTVIEQDLPVQKVVTSNISAGGVCFIAYEKLASGTFLFLSFRLAQKGEVIRARGKVIWQEESFSLSTDCTVRYDTGVEFVEIEAAAREIISQHIVSFKK